jgi:hypothetical protein
MISSMYAQPKKPYIIILVETDSYVKVNKGNAF